MSTENPSGGLAVHHQYYPGASHGYLSSLAGLQSLNQSQPFNVGGGHDPASNMSLLQGRNHSSSAVSGGVQQSLAACSSSPPLALPFCPSVPSSNGDGKVSDIKVAPLFSCLLIRLLPRSCHQLQRPLSND
ncbi:hypothetical protein ACFX2C_029797 [Malus domestica]